MIVNIKNITPNRTLILKSLPEDGSGRSFSLEKNTVVHAGEGRLVVLSLLLREIMRDDLVISRPGLSAITSLGDLHNLCLW